VEGDGHPGPQDRLAAGAAAQLGSRKRPQES
jgi:hypothetical protein